MRPRVFLAAVVAAAAVAGCSSDDAAGPSTTIASTATSIGVDVADPDALTGEMICERLSKASVTADTGLDVTRAVPDDTEAPTCVYEYTNDADGISTVTVTALRSQDLGGRTGREAFDFVVERESSAATASDTQEVSAGDAGIRITGPTSHLGVVQLGDQVLTVTVAVDDVEADAVDRLISTMATTLD